MFAIALHLMRGTPYIYNGEEIGMTNCPVKDISEVEDLESVNMYNERLKQGYTKDELIRSINAKGRDNARRPMQWSASFAADFTTGTPWLALNPNYQDINVQTALADPESIFYTYQKLIKLRHENEIIVNGSFTPVSASPNVLAYYRELAGERWLVVANLTGNEERFSAPDKINQVLISNYNAPQSLNNINLRSYEAFAVVVK